MIFLFIYVIFPSRTFSVFVFYHYTQPSSCLEGATVQVGSSETPSEVRVYCNVRDGGVPTTTANRTAGDGWLRSTHCKLSLPRDAQTLSLAYGRGTARYAYYGTDDGDCGASFPKPVTPAEVGRWRCANTMSDGRVYGGFIVVNGTKGTDSCCTKTRARVFVHVNMHVHWRPRCGRGVVKPVAMVGTKRARPIKKFTWPRRLDRSRGLEA